MNEEQFKGHYNEMKGKLKERWGRLTDDELTQINGRRDQLLGKIQVKYGIAKERAENELNRFLDSYSPTSAPSSSSKAGSFVAPAARKEAAPMGAGASFKKDASSKKDGSFSKDASFKKDGKNHSH